MVIGHRTSFLTMKDSDRWGTPQWLYDYYNERYHFTLDAAAEPLTAKCEHYYTIEDNCLAQSWAGETVWLNPPFSNPLPFVFKAVLERHHATTVMLVRDDCSTKWFKLCLMHATEIIRLQDRLKFIHPDGTEQGNSVANFNNSVIVFGPHRGDELKHSYLDLKGLQK